MTAHYAQIPIPQPDLNSLQQCCMRLKESVDQIVGVSVGVRMAGIYVQDTTPDADRDGRLWLCTLGTNFTLNVALHGKWLKVGTLT